MIDHPCASACGHVDRLQKRVTKQEPSVRRSLESCGGTSNLTAPQSGELGSPRQRWSSVTRLTTPIDAGVRDVADLTAMEFPVWSKAISAQGTVKATPGWVNTDVVCAGMTVHPGDVIVADMDGVVVVPQELAAEVAALGDTRIAKEEKSRQELKAGVLSLDRSGLRAKLVEMGVEWVEEA